MSAIVTLIVAIVILALLLYGESLLPIDGRLVRLIQALTVVMGVIWLAQRFGVF